MIRARPTTFAETECVFMAPRRLDLARESTAMAAKHSTTPITAKVSLKPITSAWRLTVLPSAMMACCCAAAGRGRHGP